MPDLENVVVEPACCSIKNANEFVLWSRVVILRNPHRDDMVMVTLIVSFMTAECALDIGTRHSQLFSLFSLFVRDASPCSKHDPITVLPPTHPR